MAQQTINIGSVPDDGTGDTIRDGFDKVNDNFNEIYQSLTFGTNNVSIANTIHIGNSSVNAVINSSSINLGNTYTVNTTAVSVGSNVVLNTTRLFVGNSTVNTIANSSLLRSSSVSVLSNTGLTLGSSTTAANGYSFLPNGIKLNWGWVSANSTAGNATFTSSYNTLFIVTATSNSITDTYQAAVISSNTTEIVIRTSNATSVNVHWIAIGT